jgi:hypothetical protein
MNYIKDIAYLTAIVKAYHFVLSLYFLSFYFNWVKSGYHSKSLCTVREPGFWDSVGI